MLSAVAPRNSLRHRSGALSHTKTLVVRKNGRSLLGVVRHLLETHTSQTRRSGHGKRKRATDASAFRNHTSSGEAFERTRL